MKKIIYIILALTLLTGCKKEEVYNGSVTEESKKFLDKGYIVNIYRSKEDIEYNKAYIEMTFHVITDYYSTNEFNEEAPYNIKRKTVTNIKITKSPKMGIVDGIFANYTLYDEGDEIKGTKNYFKEDYEYPHTTGVQTSIAVKLSKIAILDATKYETLDLKTAYNDLGITNDSVRLTLSFRVELLTRDNKTYYKDYNIEMPDKTFNIAGTDFQTNKMIEDIKKMEPFKEK